MNSSKKQMKNGNIYLVIALIVVIILFYSSSQTYGQQSQVSRLESWLPNQPFKDTLAGIRFNYGGSMVSIDHLGYAKFLEFFLKFRFNKLGCAGETSPAYEEYFFRLENLKNRFSSAINLRTTFSESFLPIFFKAW